MAALVEQERTRIEVLDIRSLGQPLLPALMALSLMGNSSDNPSPIGAERANIAADRNDPAQTSQLSERERRLILEIRKARREKDERSQSERCVDEEVGRLGRSPSALEWRVIDLKCREIGGPSVVPEG